MSDERGPLLPESETARNQTQIFELRRGKRWILVALNAMLALLSQSAGILLVRFYYAEGGSSKWLITFAQTAAFPLLFAPLISLPRPLDQNPSIPSPSILVLASVYALLGVLFGTSNVMFSTGLSYLTASTYSLICATQLAFNAVFLYFLNAQKFTALILNSVVVLSLSAALISVNDDSEGPSGVSRPKYVLGFVCTLAASAMYSLMLSLTQLTFQRVLRSETFSVVIKMQIYTSLVATCISLVGLFASGEWEGLRGEMRGFGKGGESGYVATLVGTAVAWQAYSVSIVGLIFVVSSLFANVISTLSLAVTPIASVIVFHDSMNGLKIIAMLMAIWGFASYIYQNYVDDLKARKAQTTTSSSTSDNDSFFGNTIS